MFELRFQRVTACYMSCHAHTTFLLMGMSVSDIRTGLVSFKENTMTVVFTHIKKNPQKEDE